ncbi:MAG TPA: site-2 protease family protein [Pirellulales bacterium]|jgi:Zn-dependent protease|nr:site-2 protease family protein [Pirellulales bacterium]
MNPPPVPPELPPAADNPSLSPMTTVPHQTFQTTMSTGPAASFPPVPMRMLDEVDLGMRPRRRVLPLVLFLLTCFFTYAAGTYHWQPVAFGLQIDHQGANWDWDATWNQLKNNWQDGLLYMSCVMAVLLAHEMGHFLMTVRYRVPASYPIFLPMPMMLTGTMGAVIGMEGFRANRRQMFDIGLAGPLAGLVVTIPLVWLGIKLANQSIPQHGELIFGDPLLAKWLIRWLRPDIGPNEVLARNPIYMAGWVGMFVTGLNMMPISQLDGGHVIYALFLRRSRILARGFLLGAIAFIVVTGKVEWTLMVVIVTFIGVDHPRTSDDSVPLGPWRIFLGIASLVLPILCFTPFKLGSG